MLLRTRSVWNSCWLNEQFIFLTWVLVHPLCLLGYLYLLSFLHRETSYPLSPLIPLLPLTEQLRRQETWWMLVETAFSRGSKANSYYLPTCKCHCSLPASSLSPLQLLPTTSYNSHLCPTSLLPSLSLHCWECFFPCALAMDLSASGAQTTQHWQHYFSQSWVGAATYFRTNLTLTQKVHSPSVFQ